jgi:hypothetical protein
MSSIVKKAWRSVSCLLMVGLVATPASAQQPPKPDSGFVMAVGIDLVNQYVFRGVRQNTTGIAVWPSVDFTARFLSSDGVVKRVNVTAGFWNSLQSGDTGSSGPIGKPWYESRISGTVGLQFGGGVSVAPTYTAYTSPSDLFTTVKELDIKLALDDSRRLARVAMHPYALFAFELDAVPGVGQLDGGLRAGRYLEVGASPIYSVRLATIAVPIKVGLSLGDYYELAGNDNKFGFASVGARVTAPIGGRSKIGGWNVHGGVEIQAFGETTKVFNGGDRSKVIASFGVGLNR